MTAIPRPYRIAPRDWAINPGQSQRPDHWKGLLAAWVPAIGVTGGTVPNVAPCSRHLPGTLTSIDASTGWTTAFSSRLRMTGHAVTFDGSADYIDCNCTTASIGNTGFDLSVIAIAKNHGSPSTREGIVSCFDSSGGTGWALRYEAGATPANGAVFACGDWSGAAAYYPDASFTVTDWNHYAGTKVSGNTVSCFVNGRKGTDDTGAVLDGTANNIDIGADFARTASRYWDGEIAMVLIYDHCLSDAFIFEHAADPFAMFRRRSKMLLHIGEAAAASDVLPASLHQITTGVTQSRGMHEIENGYVA